MQLARCLRITCPLLFMALCFACSVMGQTDTATISGRVMDSTGGPVVGAAVELRSVERCSVTNATTNDAGIYVFASVQPTQYQITVQKAGFKRADLLGLL